MVLSLDDEPWGPSKRLVDMAVNLASDVPKTRHPILSDREGAGPRCFEIFPGEHYHLLTTLCRLLKANSVWEFGCDTGMGTVALLEGLNAGGAIFTVDIAPIATKSSA